MTNFEETDIFKKSELKNESIKLILLDVIKTIKNKNYDPINQIIGYIKTDNPVYIPRDNDAREKIMKLNKDDILEFLLYYFIKEN